MIKENPFLLYDVVTETHNGKENTMSGLFNEHDKYERDSKKIGWNRRIRPYACAGAQFQDGAPIRYTPKGMDASEFINTTTEKRN